MKTPKAAPFQPQAPVLEPGMPGYGGYASGSPDIPGMPGAIAGQGGYTDASGTSHPYSSPEGQQVFQTLAALSGTPPPPQKKLAPYQSDPGYQAALAMEQAGLGQLDSSLKAARERAIIDFGDPSLANMAGFGLDPQAAAFAKQNYLSGNAQLARYDKQHDLMRQAVINRLASHGILASGDLGYGVGQADQQYGNSLYDARSKLLDYLNGLTSQDNAQRQNLHGSVISALQNAWSNFLQQPSLYPANQAPQAPAQPAASTAAKAVRTVLENPYVTGRKKRG